MNMSIPRVLEPLGKIKEIKEKYDMIFQPDFPRRRGVGVVQGVLEATRGPDAD